MILSFKYLLCSTTYCHARIYISDRFLTCIGLVLESGDVIVSTGFSLPFKVSQSVSAQKYTFAAETVFVHFQILVISRLYVYGK